MRKTSPWPLGPFGGRKAQVAEITRDDDKAVMTRGGR